MRIHWKHEKGGISLVCKGYAEATNKFLKSYGTNKPKSYIILLDTNNLYEHSTEMLNFKLINRLIKKISSTIMFIKFWDFLMVEQIFLLPQVKRSMVISNNHSGYELSHSGYELT